MEKKVKYWLLAIFIITLTVRLVLAFTSPNLTYESYFHLRQVEQITETGLPQYQDTLSYGGREMIFPPAFHYLAAFFNLFLPLGFVAKLLPNILIASLVIIVYLISKKITNNDNAALGSALITGFLPVLFSTNSFTPNSLFLPLIFLTVYAFINIKAKNALYIYIATFFIASLTSSATILLLLGFAIYLILSLSENKKIKQAELEVMIFSVFFFIWIQFLFYKNIFLKQGLGFIWQNIPTQIVQQYFPQVSIPQAILLVSVVPFLIGVVVAYRALFKLKTEKSFLLISFVISTTALAWFKLIEFHLSLSFFAIILAILFASFYHDITNYMKKTKAPKLIKYLQAALIILILATTIYPAINVSLKQDLPLKEEIDAFRWLQYNSPQNAGVVSLLKEGHLITHYSKRKNLMDDHFNLIEKVEERFTDLNSLFTTKFKTQALQILDKYQIKYLIISPSAKDQFKIEELSYATEDCFELVYDEETKIYQVKCQLSATS